jgi:hypothetical protein
MERNPYPQKLHFHDVHKKGYDAVIIYDENNKKIGNPLNDNSWAKDYFRYHDIFHFCMAHICGRSRVLDIFVGNDVTKIPHVRHDPEEGVSVILFPSYSESRIESAKSFISSILPNDYDMDNFDDAVLNTKNIFDKIIEFKKNVDDALCDFTIAYDQNQKRVVLETAKIQ